MPKYFSFVQFHWVSLLSSISIAWDCSYRDKIDIFNQLFAIGGKRKRGPGTLKTHD